MTPPDRQAYSAYGYLEPGDFQTFELAPEFGRVPSWDPGLSPEQRLRVDRLLSDTTIISLHDHPVRFPADMAQTPALNRTGRQHTAFAGLAESSLTAVFDNMMDGTGCVTGNAPWKWLDIVTDLGMRQADIAHQDAVSIVHTVSDIRAAKLSGGTGIVLGLEGATPIENELDRLEVLFGLGVRQIGIAYNDANGLGSGLNDAVDAGLTGFGAKARAAHEPGGAADRRLPLLGSDRARRLQGEPRAGVPDPRRRTGGVADAAHEARRRVAGGGR